MQRERALLVFPVLAIVSLYPLWTLMFQNGTLDAMRKAVQQQQFEDGTILRTVYVGLAPIDRTLSILAAFTYYPTNGKDLESRLLYIEILSALQTGQLWCLIEGLRSGRASALFAMPAIWGLLWNSVGAGIILPIFAFFQLRNRPQKPNILLGDAKALIPALAVASYLPSLMAVAPPLVAREPYDHQTIVGYFQMTPLALTTLHYVLSQVLRSSKSTRFTSDLQWIRGAFAFAGFASSISHIYALASALFSSSIHRSIYWGISNAHVSAANVDKLALGAAFFLQWDLAIIYISTFIWGAFLVREKADVNIAGLALGLVMMSALLGPGAMMSFVFYWRESRIRVGEVGRQRKKM